MGQGLAASAPKRQMAPMFRTIETDQDIAEGLSHLTSRDQRLAEIVQRLGAPPLRRQPPGLSGLLRIVTEQMLSLQSADGIWRRVETNLVPLEPQTILKKRDASLLKLGLSRAKAKTFKALARAV